MSKVLLDDKTQEYYTFCLKIDKKYQLAVKKLVDVKLAGVGYGFFLKTTKTHLWVCGYVHEDFTDNQAKYAVNKAAKSMGLI